VSPPRRDPAWVARSTPGRPRCWSTGWRWSRRRAASRRCPRESSAPGGSCGPPPVALSTGAPTGTRPTRTRSTESAPSRRPSSPSRYCGCATPAGSASTTPSRTTSPAPGSAGCRSATCSPTPPACRRRPTARGGNAHRAVTGPSWLPALRPPGSGPGAATTTPTSATAPSASCSPGPTAYRGRRWSSVTCSARWGWGAPPPGRLARPPGDLPCTRSPTCCCPSRSTTPARWGRPGSCGPPWGTSRAGPRSSPATLVRSWAPTPSRRCSNRSSSATCPVSRGRRRTASAGRSGTSTASGMPVTAAPCPASSPACRWTPPLVTGS